MEDDVRRHAAPLASSVRQALSRPELGVRTAPDRAPPLAARPALRHAAAGSLGRSSRPHLALRDRATFGCEREHERAGPPAFDPLSLDQARVRQHTQQVFHVVERERRELAVGRDSIQAAVEDFAPWPPTNTCATRSTPNRPESRPTPESAMRT